MEQPSESGDRRPIASRDWKVSTVAARWLAARRVSPNSISIAGMLCGTLGGVALAATAEARHGEGALWLAAAVLVQCRLLANMLDGMVAIESRCASRVGELFNEVPDRVSDSAILIGLGLASGGHVLLGFATALLAMFTACARLAGKVAGASQEFCGPMAKQHRMCLVTLAALFCALAPRHWRTIGGVSVVELTLGVIAAGCAWTAARRLTRAGRALRGRSP